MLLDSKPQRDVVEPVQRSDEKPILSAQGVRVSYPVGLPGFKGWFKKGEFVAVQGADMVIAPGQTLSDAQILQMNFLVEGVKGSLPR